MKTFYISLDRPGCGWSEIVQAKTLAQAKKIANNKHYGEPCNTGYEWTEEDQAYHEAQELARNRKPRYFDMWLCNKINSLYDVGTMVCRSNHNDLQFNNSPYWEKITLMEVL